MDREEIFKWLEEQADLFDQQGLATDFEFGARLAYAVSVHRSEVMDNVIMRGALKAISLGSLPASEQAQKALDSVSAVQTDA